MAKTETSGDRCAVCGKRMADTAADGRAVAAGHTAVPAYGASADRAAANGGRAAAGAGADGSPADRAAANRGAAAASASPDRAAANRGSADRGSAAAGGAALSVREGAAQEGGCCESCWRSAVASSTESVRTAIARRPGAPEWALTALAADPSPLVRAEVALRTDLPAEVVEALADPGRERDRTVLRRMARHPALGRRAWLLAALNDLVVQRQLARNPSTPSEVLTWLARHTDPTVSGAARARLISAALDTSQQERLPVGVRAFLAARPPGQR